MPRLPDVGPKHGFKALPLLNTSLRGLPGAEPLSPSPLELQPLSFETVAAAICAYRIALLNYETSDPEDKWTNARALDESIKAVQGVFDNYDYLSVPSRQLVGVFLKELHYEGGSRSVVRYWKNCQC